MTSYFDIVVQWVDEDVSSTKELANFANIAAMTKEAAEELVLNSLLEGRPSRKIFAIVSREAQPSWMKFFEERQQKEDEKPGCHRGITL